MRGYFRLGECPAGLEPLVKKWKKATVKIRRNPLLRFLYMIRVKDSTSQGQGPHHGPKTGSSEYIFIALWTERYCELKSRLINQYIHLYQEFCFLIAMMSNIFINKYFL